MALITTEQRAELVALFTAMFKAAPGANYLSQMVASREAGQTLSQIAAQLATKPEFATVYPGFQTAQEFADALVGNMLASDIPASAKTWATNWVVTNVAAGKSRAQVITEAVLGIRGTTNPNYASSQTLLANKVDVASYYSITKGLSDPDLVDLQSVILPVTTSATTVTAAKAVIDGQASVATGKPFSFGINQDALVGTDGNDTFTALVVTDPSDATKFVDTIQSVDTASGGLGTDTLIATLNNGTNTATPGLTGIENAELRSTVDGSGLTFSATTGLQQIKVAASSGTTKLLGVGGISSLIVANQAKNVSISGQTATTLALTLDTVATGTVIDLGETVAASKATTLNIVSKGSDVEVKDTQGTDVATTVTVDATGTNKLNLSDGKNIATLTVTGAGSLDVSATDLVKVATLTAGDGGITFKNGAATATLTATTGAGKDSLSILGSKTGTISVGGGNDTVASLTDGLLATSVIDLGAGDDSLTLAADPAGGVTLSGGEGSDSLGMAAAQYATISGFSATNLGKITGFEVLSITGAALADATNLDLSKIAGITSAQILGVVTTKAATISNVGANSSVVLKGDLATNDGALTVSLKDATGTADVLNLTLNQSITQNNDGTVDTFASDVAGLTLTGIETVNVTSTGTLSAAVTAGNKTDTATNLLKITDNDLVTLNIAGDQGFSFTSAAGMTKLVTVNAGTSTGATFTGGAESGNVIDLTAHVGVASAGVTVTGSSKIDLITGSDNADTITAGAGADVVLGGKGADTIDGGDGADKITGGAGGDKITTGAGNDIVIIAASTDSNLVQLDIISDFQANTVGQGAGGAATSAGATATVASRNGDVIDLSAATPAALELSVQSNASDAQTFIQNAFNDGTVTGVNIALDSSSGKLYVDFDNDGNIDIVMQLTGVTTITTAAFVI